MNAVVAFTLKQRVLMVALMLFVFVAGIISFLNLNIEAYPDPVPPRVEVITQNPGASAEEIERYITIPIEIQMTGIRHVRSIRTISLFGLSDVRVEFTYDYTYDEAESKVINRLSQVPPLPNGATPAISPANPIGEIYRYRVVGPPAYSVTDLKTIQDWILERRFKAVPGVMDVSGWAGLTKTYEITVDLKKLLAYGLTLPQMLQTLNNSNVNVGGQTINFGPQAAVVRGVGLIHTLNDLRNTMLTSNNSSPVYVKDVATVIVGHKPRLGIVGQDDDEDIVQGIVLMRRGEQSLPTIRRVEAEVEKINTTGILPPGVRLEKIYDRRELINVTTRTVLHNMIFGIVLIFLVQWIFLGNLRTAVIVAATIPFALFFAITIMVLRGESANLLSVGAIDFGLVVDATVIMVENIFRHLSEGERHHEYAPIGIAQRAGLTGKLRTILRSASEVSQAIFFAAGIIIAGFLPLFTLGGVEGHIFGPMAKTYAYAIAGGLVATFTISPALSALLLPEKVSETETLIVRGLRRVYEPVLNFAVANRIVTLGGAAVLAAFAVLGVRALGLEFLPHLEEGNLWIRATMPPTISLEEATPYVNRMRQIIRGFPEVVTVISQLGRPDDGTDATGFFNAEFNVPLKPFDTWPEGVDKEKLTQQINDALAAEFPGVDFNFSQYIQDNVEEAASGVKGENSIKLYGNDLDAIQKTAYKINQVMKTVPGVTDLAVFDTVGQPTVNIEIDRARGALRLGAGRHQHDDPGRDWRDRCRQCLRIWQRPEFPDHSPAGAAIPPKPRRDPSHHRRRGKSERQRGRPNSPRRCRQAKPGLGSFFHLSRKPGTLHPNQIQCARPGSRQRSARGAAQSRRAGCVAARLASRMGRRIRRTAGGDRPARGRGAAEPRSHLCAAVLELRLNDRHNTGGERNSDGVNRRHICAGPDGNSVQRIRRDRLRRAVRHLGNGWDHRHRVFQYAD
jgi:heavy metal efflux system protein